MENTKILNEINDIRTQMGLALINEEELIEKELSKIDLDPLNEGWWENAKYAMSKLGRYKSGGKIFGKAQTDSKANAQIFNLVTKKGNEMIKDLDASIKAKNPEFPNNKSQETFLNTVIEIATVYDSIVGSTKLKPTDAGYLPLEAANILIEDLREYAKKYLDVDLTAAFSVFNEAEEVKDIEDKDPDDIKVLDYGDVHKTKDGEIDNPMPKGTGFANEEETINEVEPNLKSTKDKVAGKFADTKASIKKGDLEGFDSARIKTLKSWRLPLTLMGTSASFGALSWLVEYMWGPKELITSSAEQITTKTQEVLGNIKPGQGMTQIFNEVLGMNLSSGSNPTEVVDAITKIGGGDATKGVEIITQNGGIFKNSGAAKETLTELIKNPTANGNTLGDVFKGDWAGTGKSASDTLVTVSGGTLTGIIAKAATKFVVKRTMVGGAKAAIAAPIIKTLGLGLLAGGAVVALARYKGRKSSRAQVLNDLVQFIRPVDVNDAQGGGAQDANTQGDNTKAGKSSSDKQLYVSLKKYFQDLYNFKSQVNTDTYGTGGSGNAQKTYTGSRDVKQNLTKPNDADDLLKLLETFELMSEETIDEIGLSSNQVKLFKSNVQRLTQLIQLINKFNTQDKNLNGLISSAKSNPVATIKINDLLQSDPKSLKIFVSDFNKALYATQFKNGNDIMTQLKKVNINKLSEEELVDEKAERETPKGAMNKVYNERRDLLKNLQGFVKTLYSIFSYLIDNMNNTEDQGVTPETKSGNKPKGSNEPKADNEPTGNKASTGGEGSNFRDLINNLDESAIGEALTPEMLTGKEEALLNSENGKIFTQLAKVIPDLSIKIANSYQKEYKQTINKVRLSKFLETVLGAMAMVPQQRMVMMINKSGMDISAYKKMLRDIKNLDGDTLDATPEQGAVNTGDVNGTSKFDINKPESFLPNNVGSYNLTGQKKSFRIGLAQKAAEIISRNVDYKLDQKNMLTVMKQLIDNLNSKHGANIPQA
jgi:hypothetical protein